MIRLLPILLLEGQTKQIYEKNLGLEKTDQGFCCGRQLWHNTTHAQFILCMKHIQYCLFFFLMYVVGYCFIVMFNTEIVHALMACNAGTELTCISNIEEHVKLQNMPVLSYILQRWV